MQIKIVNQSQQSLPGYATPGSAGLDIRANLSEKILIKPLERVMVPTGIYLDIPEGYEVQVRPRSGLAWKHGITVLNSPGTIDSDYKGEIKILLINFSDQPYELEPGERIAQLVVAAYQMVEWLEVDQMTSSQRGSGGFGSTGKN